MISFNNFKSTYIRTDSFNKLSACDKTLCFYFQMNQIYKGIKEPLQYFHEGKFRQIQCHLS